MSVTAMYGGMPRRMELVRQIAAVSKLVMNIGGETSCYSPMSGMLAKLKNNKNKLSFDKFVDRYFWIDTKNNFLRYAKSKRHAEKKKIKGMHIGDITDVEQTAHENFFIVYGKPQKLMLRASDSVTAKAWINAIRAALKSYKEKKITRKTILKQNFFNNTNNDSRSNIHPIAKDTDDDMKMENAFHLNLKNIQQHDDETMKGNGKDAENVIQKKDKVFFTSTSIKYKKNHVNDLITPRTAREGRRGSSKLINNSMKSNKNNNKKNISPATNRSTIKIKRSEKALSEYGGIKQSSLISRKGRRLYSGRKQRKNHKRQINNDRRIESSKIVKEVVDDDENDNKNDEEQEDSLRPEVDIVIVEDIENESDF